MSAYYPIAREDHLNKLRTQFKSYWDDYWKTSVAESGKGLFLRNIRETEHQCLLVFTRNRRETIVLHRLRMGHVGLFQYLHRFNMHDSNLCIECNRSETVEHFLLHCSKYDDHRQRLVSSLVALEIVNPTVRELLGGGDYNIARGRKILQITMAFVRATGRLEEL